MKTTESKGRIVIRALRAFDRADGEGFDHDDRSIPRNRDGEEIDEWGQPVWEPDLDLDDYEALGDDDEEEDDEEDDEDGE